MLGTFFQKMNGAGHLFLLAIWCITCCTSSKDGFLIKHYSGLCLAVHNGTNEVYLKKSCDERFVWTSTKSIMHAHTKLCLVPKGAKDNAVIIAKNACNSSFSCFTLTGNQSLRHVATKKCMHPYWGCPVPLNGESMVLHSECDEERLKFHFKAIDSDCEPLYPYCAAKSQKIAKSSNCVQKEAVKGLDWHWVYVIITIGSAIIIGQFIFIVCTYCKVKKRLKNQSEKKDVITFRTSDPEDPLPQSASRDVHVISVISTEHGEHDEFSDSSTSTLNKNESAEGDGEKAAHPYINVDFNQNKDKDRSSKSSSKRKSSKERNSRRLSKLSVDLSKMRHLFKIRKSYTLTDLETLKRISIEQHEYEEPISPISLTPQPFGKKSKAEVRGEGSGYVEPDTKCVRGRSASVPAKFMKQSDGYLQPVISERDKKKCSGNSSVAYVNLKPSSPLRTEKNLYDMPQMSLIQEETGDCLQVEAHTYLTLLDSQG